MLENIPQYIYIEDKKEISSLNIGSPVQLCFTSSLFDVMWTAYGGLVNDKYAFMRKEENSDNILSFRCNRDKISIWQGAILASEEERIKNSFIYKQSSPEYVEMLKMLERAGL